MSTPDEIRAFAKQNGTREAITPAVLYLLQQGETPTGHAVYKLLGQGSQTTINNQIKVAYQELSGLITPLLAVDSDAPATPNIPLLFNAFLKLFDQAALAASATWCTEKAELKAANDRADELARAIHAKLEHSQQTNATLSREIAGLKAMLEQAGTHRDELTQTLRDTQAHAQLLDANFHDLNSRLSAQAVTHDNAISMLNIQHESKLRELETLHANALSSADKEFRNQLAAQMATIERQQQALMDADRMCKEHKAELEKSHTVSSELRLQLALARRDNEILQDKLTKAGDSDRVHDQKMAALEDQNRMLQVELNELRTQMAALKAANESLDGVIQRLAKPAPRRAQSKKRDV